MSGVLVVKVGGSLMRSDAAVRLLQSWPAASQRRCVVVAGGGAFADAVRTAQQELGFTDVTAHHLALAAMEMSARALASVAARFTCASTIAEFEHAWQRALTPIWLPVALVDPAPDVPASWDMTSDSLSAWLANHLDAAELLVVKSCAVPASLEHDANALAAAGIVDPCFPHYVADRRFRWRIVSGVDAALARLS
ncbi:MAG: aspartate kinase [Burkholderiales bacterium]|nr:aspartate kinase [Burkholderiales bacterium]